MNKKDEVLETEVYTTKRPKNEKDFVNVYLLIGGRRFEVVPHCRTLREKAYFYAMLQKSDIPNRD